MSRHLRSRLAKLAQDLDDEPEVVIMIQPWALPHPAPETREAPATPPAPTPPEPRAEEPDSRCPTCGAQPHHNTTSDIKEAT
jgi:hypothetical protein